MMNISKQKKNNKTKKYIQKKTEFNYVMVISDGIASGEKQTINYFIFWLEKLHISGYVQNTHEIFK